MFFRFILMSLYLYIFCSVHWVISKVKLEILYLLLKSILGILLAKSKKIISHYEMSIHLLIFTVWIFLFLLQWFSVFIFLMLLLLSNNLNEIHLRLKLITSALYYLNHSSYSITSLEVTRALFLPLSAWPLFLRDDWESKEISLKITF